MFAVLEVFHAERSRDTRDVQPENIDEMIYHIAAKLVEPFGIEVKEYRRWNGL